MAPASVEFDNEFQLCAGSAFDEHLGLRTWSGARPAGTRLEARVAAGGTAAEIDLVRRCAIQGRVGSFRVVPGAEQIQFAVEQFTSQRHATQQSSTFPFQAADEPLDDCDAATLAHRAMAVADVTATAPVPEGQA